MTRQDQKSKFAAAAARRAEPDHAPAGRTAVRSKPVRVTLNIPPELFREVTRWCDAAAEEIGEPRVSVQDALRAMVAAGVADASASSAVIAELRRK